MGIKIHKVLVLFFCLSSTISFSQKKDKELEKANAKYEELSFVKAGKLYERLVEKGYNSKEIYARLGDTYFFNSDYSNALKWYSKLFEDGEYSLPEYFYRYSVCLRATDNPEEALSIITSHYEKAGKEEEAKKWDPIVYLQAIAQQSDRYDEVGEAGINSALSDFGTAFVPNEEAIKQAIEIAKFEKRKKARAIRENEEKRRKDNRNILGTKEELSEKKKEIVKEDIEVKKEDKLPKYKEVIYATAKDSGFLIKRKHNWNDKPFLKLYSAQIDEAGELKNEKKLSGDINTKYDQSTPIITKDGLTMYFTRLVPYDKIINKAKNKKAIAQLKLYQAQKVNGKWTNLKQLPHPINVDGTSSAHPALSPNDDQLYFVSNRKKKMNDTDLYVIDRKKSGGFATRAESLGEDINTYGRETFPFVDDSGILYFSSDGHPGLGGLDVLAAVKGSDGKYVVVNVGEPINSVSDDFAYVIDNESKKGFFSSNRKGGTGDDDLYKFLEIKPIAFPFKLRPDYFGTIKDSASGKPLDNVEITVYNDLNEVVKTLVTDISGKYLFDLPALKNYSFVFKKKGYTLEKLFVEGLKMGERKDLAVALFNELTVIVDDKVVMLKDGDDLTNKLRLNPIYFDYGGYIIRKSSKIELDKVINLMKSRPSLSIEVRSHTDSRGKDDYNMKLSKNRAKTTTDYIVLEGGISRDRVRGDGYGESQLINKCSDGVKCTEVEHELNRRSEFIIIIKEQN
ncbi:OmpA family protein [Flavobacterium sp. LS1R47]|uniref:OmpA family protein n=1 Tax=Flavobacterium frigoritolerans TaxID=2987686 RepID=A0A9X2ZIT8_9FLAO|nr:OmpA family protein [Flavobacterium frigoritolerans]MCV9931565.1 OmpA family protein [Flavobacterium frigoritolerans]